MSENIAKLNAFVKELNERRRKYNAESPAAIRKIYKRGRTERPPHEFRDSSFLYIKSYPGDQGVRPFNGITFWNSPDIDLVPATGTSPIADNIIKAGTTYLMRCRLHNRGDVGVPYPKVEFFLTDPSLGFDTRYATYLGVTQMNGILLSDENGEADHIYRVPVTESGHKCLFARTFSFSPLDKPNDIYALDPTTDRHVAQKNLNVVAQGEPYKFKLIHTPIADEQIMFQALNMNELMELNEPFLASLKWNERTSPAVFARQEIKVLDTTGELNIERGRAGFNISAKGNRRDPVQKTVLTIDIPDFGLQAGEAAAFNIININSRTEKIKGGITLVVKG